MSYMCTFEKRSVSMELMVFIVISFAFLLSNLPNSKGDANQTIITCSYQEFEEQFPCGENKTYVDEPAYSQCLFYGNGKETYEDAVSECSKYQGYLVSDHGTNDIVAQGAAYPIWLGPKIFTAAKDGLVQKVFGGVDLSSILSLDLVEIKNYICEIDSGRRLYPPTIQLKYSDPARQAFKAGEPLRAICQGFVGMDGMLFFRTHSLSGKVTRYGVLRKEVVYLEDREYVINKNRCDRRSRAAFVTKAAGGLPYHQLSCCAESSLPYIACTLPTNLRVTYPTKKPSIRIQHHSLPNYAFLGKALEAYCVTYTNPDYLGPEWRILYSNQSNHSLSAKSKVNNEFDATLGQKQTLKARFIVSQKHHKSRLVCKTHRVSAESEPLIVINLPRKPEMTTHLHVLPKWVINGRQLHVSCHALVYHKSWLAWEITTVTRTITWEWDSYTSGRVKSAGRVAQVNTTKRKTGNGSSDPIELKSSFRVDVDSEFDGAFITCRIRPPNTIMYNNKKHSNFSERSRYLRVLYNRHKPELEIGNPGDDDPIVAGQVIPVTCSALVGTDGVLTVGTVGSGSSFVLRVDMMGNTRSSNLKSLNALEKTRVKMDRYGGPKITVRLNVWYSREDDGSILCCFSYDTFDNFTKAALTKQEDQFQTRFLFSYSPGLREKITPILSLWILVLMSCGLAIFCFFKAKAKSSPCPMMTRGKKHQRRRVLAPNRSKSGIPHRVLHEDPSMSDLQKSKGIRRSRVTVKPRLSVRSKNRISGSSTSIRSRFFNTSQDSKRSKFEGSLDDGENTKLTKTAV